MVYMGSKNRIAEELIPILTKNLTEDRWYVEPFAGGMNIIDKVRHPFRMANDKNPFLITMWEVFTNPNDIFEFPQEIDKELYSAYRDIFNKRGFSRSEDYFENAMLGWVGFNGSCKGRFFDGGYCGGRKDRDFVKEHIDNITRQRERLRGVFFSSRDYSDMFIPDKSVVYCDIPYKGTKQYSVSKDFDHDKFFEWCRKKTEEGCDVLISEYAAPEDFVCIWSKELTNSMNNTSTLKPTEKLFVHKSIADKYIQQTLF